jgi:filamentous hemagglutinin family protein
MPTTQAGPTGTFIRRALLAVTLASPFLNVAGGGDILRPTVATTSGGTGTGTTATAPGGVQGVPTAISKVVANSQDLLARTTAALAAVNQMQTAARALAVSGSDSLRTGLPPVPGNSFELANGLVPAAGVPADLSNPAPGENPALWTGANLPTETATNTGGVVSTTVSIQQTQQQAVLNWQSFNIGKTTSLVFDQSLGGSNEGEWVAFNKVGVTGSPSQILGSITAGGQVYVINPNGIIFGGSSQVNTHALVASSLPINTNLISSGLLDNPDTQFLFSALPIVAGVNGTPAFTPTMSDQFVPGTSGVHTLNLSVAAGSIVAVSYVPTGMAPATLVAGNDYTYSQTQASAGLGAQGTLTLTASGLQKVSGSVVSIAYTPAGNQYGDVEVLAGAQITAPSNAGNVGGRIMLVGPNVTNSGTLTTPDGQTILAAGLQVGIDAHPSTDPSLRGLDIYVGAVADPSLPSSAPAGTATNSTSALIEAPRADVTLIGSTVNQLGFIDSATSVSYNGRVDLLAEYNSIPNAAQFDNTFNSPTTTPPFLPSTTGVVTLGPESVTQILPELSDTSTIVGTQLALPSLVDIRGLAIHMASENSATGGAVLYAPSAGPTFDPTGTTILSESNSRLPLTSGVTLDAGDWLVINPNSQAPKLEFLTDQGQVYLDAGTTIDVSGSQAVSSSVEEDVVAVQLRGTELANSPLQQNGPLRGQTVDVSLLAYGTNNGVPWVGTPIGDTSGYVGLVQRTVGELTTSGGSVSINAGSSVVIQPSATVNVSGGWIDYAGGDVTTTQVLGTNGQIYDISEATPDRVYQGIYTGTTSTTDSKWNVTQTSANPLPPGTSVNPGFVQGGSGGSVSITAPAMALDGRFLGNTVEGPNQRTTSAQVEAMFANTGFLGTMQGIIGVPTPSQLSLNFSGQNANGQSQSVTPPNVVITQSSSQAAVSAFLFDETMDPSDLLIGGPRGLRGAEVDLSPAIVNSDGFGGLSIDVSGGASDADGASAGGNITVPLSTHLVTPIDSDIQFKAANIDIEGSIQAPGGSLSFLAYDFSPIVLTAATPAADPGRGQFTLGTSATLDTSGLVVDDRPAAPAPLSEPLATKGGTILIDAYAGTFLPGSTINASGGLDVQANGKQVFGNGGSISILAGQDPGIGSIPGGSLSMGMDATGIGSTLVGFAGPGATGASLTIKAPLVQVGGNTLQNGDTTESSSTLWINATDQFGNLLAPDFFSQGGFAAFTVEGMGAADANANPVDVAPLSMFPGVYISPGTIDPTTGKLIPTVIAPQAGSWMAVNPANGGEFTLVANPDTLPSGQRTPVSLAFKATGVTDPFVSVGNVLVRGDVIVGAGAIIETDPQTNAAHGVSFAGDTVTVLGSVTAPGGTISVTGSPSPTFIFGNAGGSEALPTVDLGPESLLDTQGTTVLTPNSIGLRTGSVLPGGTITVSGNVVAEKGAVLNASGWSDSNDAGGLLDVPVTETSQGASTVSQVTPASYMPYLLQSNAGTINLNGGQELYSDATLLAEAGGLLADGGTLHVTSGRYASPLLFITQSSSEVSLSVVGSGPTLPSTFTASGNAVLGAPVDPSLVDSTGAPVDYGHFSAASLAGSGLDNVTLGGNSGATEFIGAVSLSANRTLTVAPGGVISIVPTTSNPSPTVTLEAPYIAIGSAFSTPTTQWLSSLTPGTMPSNGTGVLVVNATDLVDIGDLSLQGIGLASISASQGDIRGDGTLDIAGTVSLTSAQLYPTTAGRFTVAAYDSSSAGGTVSPGTVNIYSDGSGQLPQLPLSAGGQLDVYASDINQSGVLRAPIGTINLGWTNTGAALDPSHIDQNTGQAVPTTQALNLRPGSVTSVSASDPLITEIPYGINVNGTAWVDPNGNDITAGGVPGKSVVLEGAQVQSLAGSTVSVSGGGDLYAYQWISGTGGTNDILSPTYIPNPSTPSLTSFAVIPGYQPNYAPFAPYTTQVTTGLLGSDPGYVSNTIHPGDQIYLQAGGGLPAGTYTILPARYALLPGAFLVTPLAGKPPAAAAAQPDGTTVLSGYAYNNLVPFASGYSPLLSTYVVASGTVVRTESQYAGFGANSYLATTANTDGAAAPRLPMDGGQLVLSAGQTLGFKGSVSAGAATGGSGGLVDINTSSDQDIVIGSSAPSGDLLLDPSDLSNFGAASLLIGGLRQTTSTGTNVTVTAGSITVDNAGSPLTGSDITLAANNGITLAEGAQIEQTGTQAGEPETLLFSGNGTLVRVSGNADATIERSGVSAATSPVLTVGAGASVLGTSVILDSTAQTVLDPSALLGGSGSSLTLGSGQISLQLAGAGPLRTQGDGSTTSGVVLTSSALQNLQGSLSGLSLLSYSSIDIYGTGTVGSSTFSSITLSTPEIYGDGGNATFAAKSITIKGNANGIGPDAGSSENALTGALTLEGSSVTIGAGTVNVLQYGALNLNASSQVDLTGSSTIASAGALNVTTPTVAAPALASAPDGTAAPAPASVSLISSGSLSLAAPSSGAAAPTSAGSLGASLTLTGNSVGVDTSVSLAGGALTVHDIGPSANGGIAIGSAANLDVGGSSKAFNDLLEYSNAGAIILTSDLGSVAIADGARLNVAAMAGGGNGGSLAISAPNGAFTIDSGATLLAHGGSGGKSGIFSLDVGAIAGPTSGSSSLGDLGSELSTAGFTQSLGIRVRNGDVLADGDLVAHAIDISADNGSIDVTGTIDASGATGGTVDLSATGGITLSSGSLVTVKGAGYNDAGQGGSVLLDAGAAKSGIMSASALGSGPQLNILAGSTIDLSVVNSDAIQLNTSGTSSVSIPAATAAIFPSGTPGNDFVTFGSAGTLTTPSGATASFAAGFTTTVVPGSTVVLSNAGTIAFASGGTGGPVAVSLPAGAAATEVGVTDMSAFNAAGILTLEAPQAVDVHGNPVDVQIGAIGGSILNASSIVVAGFHVYTPAGGVVDSVETQVLNNGADFAGGDDSNGTLQAGHAQAISQRLLGGNSEGSTLLSALHVEPGAEIVNVGNPAASTSLTLNNNSSTLQVPAGVIISLPEGGSQLSFSSAGTVSGVSGTVTDPDGNLSSFTAGTATPFSAGSIVSLSGPGSVTLSSSGTLTLAGSPSRTPVLLPGGATYTLGGSDGTTLNSANGVGLTLNDSGSGGSSVAMNGGGEVVLPNGIPTTDTLRPSQAGSLIFLNGSRMTFGANASLSGLAAGTAITLKAPGTIAFSNGSAPVSLILGQGTYTTSGDDSISTSSGNLVLASSWNLSNYRFGDQQTGLVEPGILEMRASGNVVFDFGASLSDGFSPAANSPLTPLTLWTAPLMEPGSASWSYQLVAGSDFSSADPTKVLALAVTDNVGQGTGSVLIGEGATPIPTPVNAITRQAFFTAHPDYYQSIRTGTGDISIYASNDVQFLNPIATVYTAGTQAPALTGFDVPLTGAVRNNAAPPTEPPFYPAQYSFGGGNVVISAQDDIASYLQTSNGLVVDSPMELPVNWLYRRGSIGPSGAFGTTAAKDVASTTWWVDFSNFFETVGTLGGGNVTLTAGNDVINVDAAAATNSRTTSVGPTGLALTPATATTIELGGGDVTVAAGDNISGGVYYVERGQGSLTAGSQIETNSARSTLQSVILSDLAGDGELPDQTSWMPTTLFVGDGSFNVAANGNVLLGPVANPFLLPQGTDNGFYYKSFFSTYALTDAVNVFSTAGSVTIADSANGDNAALENWISNVLFQPAGGSNSGGRNFLSFSEPWLTLAETDTSAFATLTGLMPPTLRVTAFSGDINLVGNVTLSPSPLGTLDLIAARNVNGTQANTLSSTSDAFNATTNPYEWYASAIDVSDASPAAIPGVTSPLGFSSETNSQQATTANSTIFGLQTLASIFDESGATSGTNVVLQNQERLHGASPTSAAGVEEPLHYGDPNPVHIYALDGTVSGFTLYAPKATQLIAGTDVTDIALYIQNTSASDVSTVAAGRDIIAYDANSELRQEASTAGNTIGNAVTIVAPGSQAPQAGDIQISGPGALEVLAGRNLDLGTGSPVTSDGLATGITSVGNARNPLLPFGGATLVVGAGIPAAGGLGSSSLDFNTFASEFLDPSTSGAQGLEHLPELASLLGVAYDQTNPTASGAAVWADFNALTATQQQQMELNMFYVVLRDAGRDRNNINSPNYGNYNAGYEAIGALFGSKLDYTDANGTGFVDLYLNPTTGGKAATTYLADLAPLIGDAGKSSAQVWSDFSSLPTSQQDQLALQVFGDVLHDAASEAGQPATAAQGNLLQTEALAALFNGQDWSGNISMSAHEIATTNGGDIDILAPGGAITVGLATDKQTPQVGILTQHGGNISIFADGTVSLGTSRIFTLQGGNEVVWSTTGNIAAGSGSKTVHSAPPTRVLVNPQSANVENDLAGLATGSGIGVLETLASVPPGNVDLIAPVGIVDAGDAGIRASGNLNIAARLVLNASNIQVGGTSAGLPPAPAAPNLAPLTAASAASAAASTSASEVTNNSGAQGQGSGLPSVISVDIISYGIDDEDDSNGGDSSQTN